MNNREIVNVNVGTRPECESGNRHVLNVNGLINSESCVHNENILATFATLYWRILRWRQCLVLSVPMLYEICIMIFTVLIVYSITILPFCNFFY